MPSPDDRQTVRVLGLMSGTSLDGVDAALLDVGGASAEGFAWRLVAFHTETYEGAERKAIREAIEHGDAAALARLHVQLGERFAEAALTCCAEAGVEPTDVSAIGSHGQTVWHHPPQPDKRGATLQLGDPATIAERTGVPVISDFRARDVAAGGHGAPLVPWPDQLLLSSPGRARAIQNLGGMANVTWLPAASGAAPVAFDTGPGVVLIDTATELATGGERSFDADGALAAAGRVDDGLLGELMRHPFIHRSPPKSTGREMFGSDFVRAVVESKSPEADRDWADIVATMTAFTAVSIADAYRRWLLPRGVDEVFLAGGGARNPVLARAIASELAPLPVHDLSELGLDPDAREAACFAVLAWAHLHGIPSNAPDATGAAGPRVLGSLTPGRG